MRKSRTSMWCKCRTRKVRSSKPNVCGVRMTRRKYDDPIESGPRSLVRCCSSCSRRLAKYRSVMESRAGTTKMAMTTVSMSAAPVSLSIRASSERAMRLMTKLISPRDIIAIPTLKNSSLSGAGAKTPTTPFAKKGTKKAAVLAHTRRVQKDRMGISNPIVAAKKTRRSHRWIRLTCLPQTSCCRAGLLQKKSPARKTPR